MSQRRTILCVIGTRPEAIKMAPVVRALRQTSWARCVVVATAQHRGLLDQMLERLQIPVDHDLDLMQEGQQPSNLLARMLPALERVLQREVPDVVLAQGDTTSVMGAALVAFHRRIPFGHVEAGLRTHDLAQPFPEEGYRQMVARVARWHFAPTTRAAEALRREGIPGERIAVTGDICIDTLQQTVSSSGGIEEEASAPHRPALVATERPEAVVKGVVMLVGNRRKGIETGISTLLPDRVRYRGMARGASPYGDGQGAQRIVGVLGRAQGCSSGAANISP